MAFATRLVQVPTAQRQTRVVRVQASQQQPAAAAPKDVPALQRRHALGLLAATGAALTLADAANAIEIPSQRSTGGLGKSGTGSIPANSSTASMEGYTMEGTRKQGISRKKKDQILAKTKAKAVAASTPSAPKAADKKPAKGKAS